MFRLNRFILMLLISPLSSFASVDMKTGNYSEIVTDLLIPGTYQLKVQRYYNSRSIMNGMFGFGWCSDFETNLEKTPDGGIRILECGAGKQTFFRPENFDNSQVAKVSETLLAEYKKNNPRAAPEFLKLYREQLVSDADFRAAQAKDMKLPIPEVVKGVSYKAEGLDAERVTFDGTQYVRNMVDGVSQRFDKNGKLTAIYDKSLNFVKLTWTEQGLREVVDNRGRKLVFEVDRKRVQRISGPLNTIVNYKYKGENLIEVKNIWNNTYKYEYSDGHNLTKIVWPTGAVKRMSYDEKRDLILSYTEDFGKPDPCTESYEYFGSNDAKHSWATAQKKCGKEVKNRAQFDFWYDYTPEGKWIMSRIASKSMTDSLDMTFHSKLGKATVIKRNGITTTFDYYPNGLMKRKDTNATKMLFTYNQEINKVSKVYTEYFDDKGKLARKRETSFDYDKRGNLIHAANSDGQTIALTYDDRGRIASMVDQAKKEVFIKYDERISKPQQITRPKVGTISISYKQNGDIQKVDSPDGPSVAVQIASTFNNLLDIISPATSELEL